jgi:hypothetical protein
MATIVTDEARIVPRPEWQIWLRIAAIGAVVGLVYWVVYMLLHHYVVSPLTCGPANSCQQTAGLSGSIATILVAVGALFATIRLSVARPVVVTVASAVVLWPLATWTAGLFWLEAVAWAIVLYSLAYLLYGWIGRYVSTVVAIVTAVVIAIILRVALMLT